MLETGYLHHKVSDAGPFHTVPIVVRRAPNRTDGTRCRNRIRSPFQYREHGSGRGWRTVWRTEPIWQIGPKPRLYAMVAGREMAVSLT